jgi:uncharacterized protein (TIGR02996 family)
MGMSDRDVEAKLLEAIRANPGDDDARRVYAEWLDERGDARGEYLRLELQLARGPSRIAELTAVIDPSWLYAVRRRYQLVLVDAPKRTLAINAICDVTGMRLDEATDLVEAGYGSVIADDLSLEEAREYVTWLDGRATVRIEEGVTTLLPIEPGLFSVVLVAVRARLMTIRRVREVIPQMSMNEARQLVDRVIAGTPQALREAIGREPAARIAHLFAPIADTRVEEIR